MSLPDTRARVTPVSVVALIAVARIFLGLQLAQQAKAANSACSQDILDRTFVTQCNPGMCEPAIDVDLDGKTANEWPKTRDEVIHIVSSREGDRFKVHKYEATDHTDYFYAEIRPNGTIFVDTKTMYQRILGFGTTLTDASCTNTDDLPDDMRSKLINDYFNVDEGIGLNLIKVPIGSTKYSYTNYVLDQPDSHQVELSSYDIDHRIPIIKDAMKAAGKLKNRMKVLASPLTAPPDCKDNNRINYGGNLRNDKIADYASYLTSFVAAYKSQGIDIWSLILSESPVSVSRDNEVNDTLDYASMVLKPSTTIKLANAITKEKSSRNEAFNFRLLMLGDNKAHIPVWIDGVIGKSEDASKQIAGVAYTCDHKIAATYDNLVYASKRYSNKYLLVTQGSINSPIKLGNWQYAENYATEIIKNLEFGSVGWIDFNMALNLEGGPVLSNKHKADAPVMVDPKKGVFYRNPMFYAIGHLSRYVKPGSVRVKVNFYSSPHMYATQHIGFITPDNYLVVVILNNNIGPMPLNIGIGTRTKVEQLLPTKSFNTFIFRL